MASNQTQMSIPSLPEWINPSSNLSPVPPVIIGFTDQPDNIDLHQDSPERSDPFNGIFLPNPMTMDFEITEGSSSDIVSQLFDLIVKDGQFAASRASIEAMPNVTTKEDEECVICLEEFGENCNELAKRMPCGHIFHGECIKIWLNINGCCPVCKHKMPVDDNLYVMLKNLFDDTNRRIMEIDPTSNDYLYVMHEIAPLWV